jgi:hypothetical protein
MVTKPPESPTPSTTLPLPPVPPPLLYLLLPLLQLPWHHHNHSPDHHADPDHTIVVLHPDDLTNDQSPSIEALVVALPIAEGDRRDADPHPEMHHVVDKIHDRGQEHPLSISDQRHPDVEQNVNNRRSTTDHTTPPTLSQYFKPHPNGHTSKTPTPLPNLHSPITT